MRFNLRRGTPADIPGMVDVWYRSFNSPEMLYIFPDSEPTRAWITESIAMGMRDESQNTIYMILTDEERDGQVVSLAKWIVQHAGGPVPAWNERWPKKVAEDMNEEVVAERFFKPMARQHANALSNRAHHFLEVVATHDEYRRRGLASRLLQWGAEFADAEGVESYLDAASSAKSLYERHGYVEQPEKDENAFPVPMLRPAKKENAYVPAGERLVPKN